MIKKSAVLLFLTLTVAVWAESDYNVLDKWIIYSDKENALYHHLAESAFTLLDQRKARVNAYTTKQEWEQHRERVKETLAKLNPLPQRTPLYPQTIDVIEKQTHRLEKIVFQSQPDFYVTAGLFVPKSLDTPAPAIIYCSGHSKEAFRSPVYQKAILNLVDKGFVVLAFDPIGQGERLQYVDAQTGESRIGGPTSEHSFVGAQYFLTGRSLAQTMIWDGIRAVDYLISRPEVDSARIGITGRSGGGTQSAYIAAYDERIKAAAPECYITSFHRLLQTRGPQDAEQNFYRGIYNGIDHADLLQARAPKPTLVISTTRDFFSIQGMRETTSEVERMYQALGAPEHFQVAVDDTVHASTKKNREAMYAFFQKFLQNPGSPEEKDVEIYEPEDLQITNTGQVVTEFGRKTAFNLNLNRAASLAKDLRAKRQTENHLQNVIPRAKILSGYPDIEPPEESVFCGRYQYKNYVMEKHFIFGAGDYVMPFLLFKPVSGGPYPAIIYLHPDGKEHADIDSLVIPLVQNGFIAAVPDLVGQGELGPGRYKGDSYNFTIGSASYNLWFLGMHIGQSLCGLRAGDVTRLAQWLARQPDVKEQRIFGMAVGESCPVLQHAVAFDDTFHGTVLLNPLLSYASLALNTFYKPSYILAAVPGCMAAYDLADLMAADAPDPVLIINPQDELNETAHTTDISNEFDVVHKAYKDKNASKDMALHSQMDSLMVNSIIREWLSDYK